MTIITRNNSSNSNKADLQMKQHREKQNKKEGNKQASLT